MSVYCCPILTKFGITVERFSKISQYLILIKRVRSPAFDLLPENIPGAKHGETKCHIFATSRAGLEPVIVLFNVPQHRMDLAGESIPCIYVVGYGRLTGVQSCRV
jgi:hypothetical protein